MPEKKTTLICTVGGSHQPVVIAIERLKPDFVCFVCSAADIATGKPGSYYPQITGKENCIKKNLNDAKPTLPNIPNQTKLKAEQFEILEVSPDNFDDIFSKVETWIKQRNLLQENIVADFTGGTKSMSAALVLMSLEHPSVELQVVTGIRISLLKIAPDNGKAIKANIQKTKFDRKISEALSLWDTRAYSEAGELLHKISEQVDDTMRARLSQARDLSRAFADWDRFDHKNALQKLKIYNKKLGEDYSHWYSNLGYLTRECPAQEPSRLFDLFRNAERRAAAARYDDAIARLYRLLEWSAQWLLKEKAQIETKDVPHDKLPEHMKMKLIPNGDGKIQVGLMQAWELAAHHCGEEVQTFWDKEKDKMKNYLQSRNHSILAHGFTALSQENWEKLHEWTENELIPLLLHFSKDKRINIKKLPEQLPTEFPL